VLQTLFEIGLDCLILSALLIIMDKADSGPLSSQKLIDRLVPGENPI